MKRSVTLSVLMMTCGLLAGCGGPSCQEEWETFRQQYAAAEQVVITGEVTASWEDWVETYGLTCVCRGDAWEVSVRTPELLQGVTARMDGTGGALCYDDAVLAVPDLTESGLSPVSVLPTVAAALRDGYLDAVWTEDGCLAASLIYDDDTAVTVWFHEDRTPKAAEVTENGAMRAVCSIEQFTIEENNDGFTEETDLGGNPSGESGA